MARQEVEYGRGKGITERLTWSEVSVQETTVQELLADYTEDPRSLDDEGRRIGGNEGKGKNIQSIGVYCVAIPGLWMPSKLWC